MGGGLKSLLPNILGLVVPLLIFNILFLLNKTDIVFGYTGLILKFERNGSVFFYPNIWLENFSRQCIVCLEQMWCQFILGAQNIYCNSSQYRFCIYKMYITTWRVIKIFREGEHGHRLRYGLEWEYILLNKTVKLPVYLNIRTNFEITRC